MRILLAILPCLLLIGCTASGPPHFDVAAGSYPAAFNAAREVLRDHAFKLERVDAQSGVITTAPKATAGLATPWDSDQSSFGREVEELFNQRARTIRISFEPADGAPAATPATTSTDAPAAPIDLTNSTSPLVGRVHVVIWQRQSTHVRLNARSVTLTSQTTDPALLSQGVGSQFDVPVERDEALAVRLAREIEKALAKPAPAVSSANPH